MSFATATQQARSIFTLRMLQDWRCTLLYKTRVTSSCRDSSINRRRTRRFHTSYSISVKLQLPHDQRNQALPAVQWLPIISLTFPVTVQASIRHVAEYSYLTQMLIDSTISADTHDLHWLFTVSAVIFPTPPTTLDTVAAVMTSFKPLPPCYDSNPVTWFIQSEP